MYQNETKTPKKEKHNPEENERKNPPNVNIPPETDMCPPQLG